MEAPVIIHRWFEQGAGWAYAPKLDAIKRELMIALDGELKVGATGTAEQPRVFRHNDLGQGRILGCVVVDDRSRDAKAQGRHPTILRAAVLPSATLRPDQEEAIIAQLVEQWPERPGQDRTLTVKLDASLPDTKARPRLQLSDRKLFAVPSLLWSRLRQSSIMKFLVIILLVAAVWWAIASHRRSTQNDLPLQAVIEEMQMRLNRWGGKEQTQDKETINHFFLFLSQQELGGQVPASKHPYIRFVSRLPATPAKDQDWTNEGVEQALRVLTMHLSDNSQDPDLQGIDPLLQRIDTLMEYDTWRKRDRNSASLPQFTSDPGRTITRYVEKFRPSAEKNFRNAANAMQDVLRRWNAGLAQPASSFAVLEQFFRTLSPPDRASIPGGDFNTAYGEFAQQFYVPIGSLGWTCDDVSELNVALKALAGDNLTIFADPNDLPASLVDRVKQRTNYQHWMTTSQQVIAGNDREPSSQALRAFVDRLKNPGR